MKFKFVVAALLITSATPAFAHEEKTSQVGANACVWEAKKACSAADQILQKSEDDIKAAGGGVR